MAKDPNLDGMTIEKIFQYGPIKKQMSDANYTEEELRPILEDHEKQISGYSIIVQQYVPEISDFKGVHSIRSRIKSVGSLCEKILRKEDSRKVKITLANYRTEIKDLIGIRALYVFPDEFATVYDQIYEKYSCIFDGKPEVRHREGDNLEIFKQHLHESRVDYTGTADYRSMHYTLHHSNPDVRIELQTRTIFEEGWSEISHRTTYGMEGSPNEKLLRVVSSILSRMVGTSNDLGSLIYSIAYGGRSESLDRKIDGLHNSTTTSLPLEDILADFIDTL